MKHFPILVSPLPKPLCEIEFFQQNNVRMNNVNARIHVSMSTRLVEHSPEWTASLKKKIKDSLLEMQRHFSEDEFHLAVQKMENKQLSLSGVTFLLYVI